MSRQEIERDFPRLVDSGYSIESPATCNYNCIAWAAGDHTRWWWPDPMESYYWPPAVIRAETIEAFVVAFASLGYIVCDNADYETGFEKIAIYLDRYGTPTHAARQLNSNFWTSKLGGLEDIEHALEGLSGRTYGSVGAFMKRRIL